MTLSPGTTLGPYAIVSQLGSGGMGQVYHTDTQLKRQVALKMTTQIMLWSRMVLLCDSLALCCEHTIR